MVVPEVVQEVFPEEVREEVPVEVELDVSVSVGGEEGLVPAPSGEMTLSESHDEFEDESFEEESPILFSLCFF